MSTFLELCQDLRQEAGISGSGPASVTSQTGENKRIVDWILKAYRYVQSRHANWDFLRTEFTFQTIANTQAYLPSAVDLTELGTWKRDSLRIYLTSTGVSDEQWLQEWAWDCFRDAYLIGPNRSVTGRPTDFAIKQDKSLVFWPVPSAIYTVRGEYFKRPQTMTENSDEPLIPAQFHEILVWRALMYYGAYESAPELYATGQQEYNTLMSELRRDQLPQIVLAGSLA